MSNDNPRVHKDTRTTLIAPKTQYKCHRQRHTTTYTARPTKSREIIPVAHNKTPYGEGSSDWDRDGLSDKHTNF
jgi:hypothetical protein